MTQGLETRFRRFLSIASVLLAFPSNSSAEIDSLASLGTLVGQATGDQFGFSVSGAGDVNNDGHADVVVGANVNDEGGSAAGKIYVFLGSASFNSSVDWAAVGTAGDFLGGDVAGIGDINGDGFDDILAGAPFSNDLGPQAGKALLYLGGDPFNTTADLTFYGEESLDQFGSTVVGLGDVNGDGFDDWAIGAFKADSGSQSDIGKVYVYFGSASPDTIADLTILGKSNGGRFGFAIAGIGRCNNDQHDDFAVGAYSYDGPSLTNIGRVYVFYGGNPPDSIPDLILTGENAHDFFGIACAGLGDVNGDGLDDLAVGATGYNSGSSADAGKAYAYQGGNPPDAVADFSYAPGQNNDDQFGTALDGVGDLDGDGRAEWTVGAPFDKNAGTDAGRAYLFRGNSSPPYPLDRTIGGLASNAEFGSAVAGVGRVADDVAGAFAVGAPAYAGLTGAVLVYASIDTASTSVWYQDADGDGFGNPSVYVPQAGQPPGYVADNTDCDDSNAAVNPSATEICNGIDDDCDGTIDEFCACACDCHADPASAPACDGVTNILDVVACINAAFRGFSPIPDPNASCPYETTDANCSGATDILDVVTIVNVAFRGANAATEFCNPCP